SAPTVTIDPPTIDNGVQATAHANMVAVPSTQVQSVTIVSAGSNYATAPTVSFSGGGGSGATAVATSSPIGAPVSSRALGSGGTVCYSTAPTVSFVGGGGAGATATATLASTNSCVAGWTVSGNCNSKKGQTVSGVGLSGTSGSGFSGTLTFNSTNG